MKEKANGTMKLAVNPAVLEHAVNSLIKSGKLTVPGIRPDQEVKLCPKKKK